MFHLLKQKNSTANVSQRYSYMNKKLKYAAVKTSH